MLSTNTAARACPAPFHACRTTWYTPGGAGAPGPVRPSQVSANVGPLLPPHPLTTWSCASRTWSFHFMVAEALACQVTDPWPVIKLPGFCLGSKIFGRPVRYTTVRIERRYA